jgi:hypothetical protein
MDQRQEDRKLTPPAGLHFIGSPKVPLLTLNWPVRTKHSETGTGKHMEDTMDALIADPVLDLYLACGAMCLLLSLIGVLIDYETKELALVRAFHCGAAREAAYIRSTHANRGHPLWKRSKRSPPAAGWIGSAD